MTKPPPTDGQPFKPGLAEIAASHQHALDLANRGQYADACAKYQDTSALLESVPRWTSLPHARFIQATIKNNMANALTSLGDTKNALDAFADSLKMLSLSPSIEREIGPFVTQQIAQIPNDVLDLILAMPEEAVPAFRAPSKNTADTFS